MNCSTALGSNQVLRAPTPLTKDVSRVYPPIPLSSPLLLSCLPPSPVFLLLLVFASFLPCPFVGCLVWVVPLPPSLFPFPSLISTWFYPALFVCTWVASCPICFAPTSALCAPPALCFFRASFWPCAALSVLSPITASLL